MDKCIKSVRMYLKLWIICWCALGIIGEECTQIPRVPYETNVAVRLPLDRHSRIRAGNYFIVYNTNKAISAVTSAQTPLNANIITAAFSEKPNGVLSRTISTTCKITTTEPTCLRFGDNGRRIPSPGIFLAMYKIQKAHIEQVEETASFDSICNYGRFKIYKSKTTGTGNYTELIENFCGVGSTSYVDVLSDLNSEFYFSYDVGSEYEYSMRVAFAVPLLASNSISVQCGVTLPGFKSTDGHIEAQEFPLNADGGQLSAEMVAFIVVICVAVIAVISVSILTLYMYIRKRNDDKNQIGPTVPVSYEQPSGPFVPVTSSYGSLDTEMRRVPTDANIYTEIPYDRTANNAARNQSNEPAVTAPEPPPLRTIPSIKREMFPDENNFEKSFKEDETTEANTPHTYIAILDENDLYSKPKKAKTEVKLTENDIYEFTPETSHFTKEVTEKYAPKESKRKEKLVENNCSPVDTHSTSGENVTDLPIKTDCESEKLSNKQKNVKIKNAKSDEELLKEL